VKEPGFSQAKWQIYSAVILSEAKNLLGVVGAATTV